MAIDAALELRRRARILEEAGDLATSREMMHDSKEQLERAQARMPASSRLNWLLKKVLNAWPKHGEGDAHTNAAWELEGAEEEIDAELERFVAKLEETLQAALLLVHPPSAALAIPARDAGVLARRPRCRYCTRTPNPGFSTCCLPCGRGRGERALAPDQHDEACRARHQLEAEQSVAAPTTELALPEHAIEIWTPQEGASAGSSSKRDGGGGGGDDGGGMDEGVPAMDAQAALRVLGLDDEWPTSLTLREIRRRYGREALRTHPDKGSEAERKQRTAEFQLISEAYHTLEVLVTVLERIRGGGGAGGGDGYGAASASAGAADCSAGPGGPDPARAGRAAFQALPALCEEPDVDGTVGEEHDAQVRPREALAGLPLGDDSVKVAPSPVVTTEAEVTLDQIPQTGLGSLSSLFFGSCASVSLVAKDSWSRA